MTRQIKYFDKLIQSKLEQLPRALKGNAPKEVLDQILLEMKWLQEAKECLLSSVTTNEDIGEAFEEEFGCRSDYFNHRVGLFNDMKEWVVEKYNNKEQLSTNEDKVSVLCACGGNERIALDCTMKPCKHPKYQNLNKE